MRPALISLPAGGEVILRGLNLYALPGEKFRKLPRGDAVIPSREDIRLARFFLPFGDGRLVIVVKRRKELFAFRRRCLCGGDGCNEVISYRIAIGISGTIPCAVLLARAGKPAHR